MENNILDTITQIKDVLPKKQRTLCNFIVLNYVEAGMMTVAELAERSGVGATTVMRLVKTLHYDSYSDFRRALLNVSLKNNASYCIPVPGIGHRPLLSSCQAAQQRKRILV